MRPYAHLLFVLPAQNKKNGSAVLLTPDGMIPAGTKFKMILHKNLLIGRSPAPLWGGQWRKPSGYRFTPLAAPENGLPFYIEEFNAEAVLRESLRYCA